MLKTKRDTDDRKAQDGSECYMEHSDLNTSQKYPYYIHEDCETASVIGIRLDLMTERPESETCQLYQLQTERNTDDGDAEKHTHNKIVKAHDKTAEHKPKNVS